MDSPQQQWKAGVFCHLLLRSSFEVHVLVIFPQQELFWSFSRNCQYKLFCHSVPFFLVFFSLTADSLYSFTSDSNVGPTEPTRETKRRVPFFLLCTVSCKRSLWSPGTDKTFHFGVLHNFDNVCPRFSFPSVSLILAFNHRYYGLLCSSDNHGPYKMTFSFFQT